MKISDINTLENKTYNVSTEQVKKKFNGNLTHHSHMRFVLNILGIEEQAQQQVNYNKLFSKEVIAFMENYLVAEKYKVEVYIKKSQTEVYELIDDTSNPNRVFPPKDTIYIWLVSEDFINYDTSFIRVQLGDNVAKDFKQQEITLNYFENFILDKIKQELLLNIYSKDKVNDATKRSLGDALFRLKIEGDKASDPILKKVFETNPALYIAIKAADFTAQKAENLKIKENRWNPRVKDFKPLLEGNTIDNAMLCGVTNGLINSAKAVPELAKLLATFFGSDEEWEKFKEAMAKLFSDKELQKALIEVITKDYKDSIETGNIEKLFYKMAYDSITVVSILIGLYGLAKGVINFINFIRKAFLYIRRYGIKSVAKLKKLGKKSILEIFERLETGSGGFYNYKRILSRDMVKQEEWMSCAAACIKRYADDFGIEISESQIRIIAKTSESGTDGKDIYLAMNNIFDDKNVFAKSYFDNIDDIKNFNTMLSDTNGEKFITNIGRYPNKHTIIVNKIDGNEVFIRDPWPLEVDKAFENGIRGVELENIFEQSEKGVQAVLDLKDFQSLWAQGGNIMFKID